MHNRCTPRQRRVLALRMQHNALKCAKMRSRSAKMRCEMHELNAPLWTECRQNAKKNAENAQKCTWMPGSGCECDLDLLDAYEAQGEYDNPGDTATVFGAYGAYGPDYVIGIQRNNAYLYVDDFPVRATVDDPTSDGRLNLAQWYTEEAFYRGSSKPTTPGKELKAQLAPPINAGNAVHRCWRRLPGALSGCREALSP